MTLFDQFWQEYPKKLDKKKARKIWERDKLDEKFNEVMEGLRLYKKHEFPHTEYKFIPYAKTWLNNERWEDEFEKETYESELAKLQETKIKEGCSNAWMETETRNLQRKYNLQEH